MSIFASMNELMKDPDARPSAPRLLIGAALCVAIYATAAGFFQGGSSVALAALKMPLILFGSVLLCIPSLYILTTLSGATYTPREFGAAVAGFCAIAGLILLALMPVTWLFSVSTLSLGFVVWLHILVWMTALVFARRLLIRTASTARGAVGFWLVLLFLVSLQMTTYFRPVLWRSPGAPLIELEKRSFFAQVEAVADWKPPAPAPLPRRGITNAQK